jgi:hypothetical protein
VCDGGGEEESEEACFFASTGQWLANTSPTKDTPGQSAHCLMDQTALVCKCARAIRIKQTQAIGRSSTVALHLTDKN